MLSSITHPALLDVVIVYREVEFGGMAHEIFCTNPGPPDFRHCLRMSVGMHQRCQQQFEVFHKMHNVRDFRLVLCADVFDCMVEEAVKTLKCFVKKEKKKGGLNYLLHEPLIISERRAPRTRCTDYYPGYSPNCPVIASAL